MKLTFVTEMGQPFPIEIDPSMEFENIMVLLEAESGIPVNEQAISYDGRELNDPRKTMTYYNVGEDSVLLLRRKVVVAGRVYEHDSEVMRRQLLGDPDLIRQLSQSNPEIVEAAQNDPARFADLLRQTRARQEQAHEAQMREVERLNRDPYDIEAQRRIEEAIRQQAINENMEHALEFSPEAFGRVTMLYIPIEVNGVPIKAFVDSGAQQTIISPECAEACGIMRLVDKRFAGIARGVGTAKIMGRVHSAQMKLADLHLACSFTVMEGREVDLLFGLDMLKAHQACIDLEKNVLRIQGREVKFLAEHELPDKARIFETGEEGAAGSSGTGDAGQRVPASSASTARSQAAAASPLRPFEGRGETLAQSSSPGSSAGAPNVGTRHPEDAIRTIMDIGGVTREAAIQLLDAAGGNVEVAASTLF